MALNLQHQTAAEFAARFWKRVRDAQACKNKVEFAGTQSAGMRYCDARQWIGTGALIAIRSRQGIAARMTRLVTRSPYTHLGIAIWCGGRLMSAEQKASGACLTPLSQYAGVDFDVYFTGLRRYDVEREIWKAIGAPVHYDWEDLLRIAANKLIGWPLPDRDDNELICSSLAAKIMIAAGWRPSDLPSIPAPCDVVAAIGIAPEIEVRK